MVGYHQCNALGRDEPRVLLPWVQLVLANELLS